MKNGKLLMLAGAIFCSMIVLAQDKDSKNTLKSEKVTADEKLLTEYVEKAEYPGGNEAMFKFISKNLEYPKYEKKKNIQGVVYAQFVIKKDGTVGDITILRSVEKSKKLDAEVLRMLRKMPKWTPATKEGIPIDFKMTLPVKFAL